MTLAADLRKFRNSQIAHRPIRFDDNHQPGSTELSRQHTAALGYTKWASGDCQSACQRGSGCYDFEQC